MYNSIKKARRLGAEMANGYMDTLRKRFPQGVDLRENNVVPYAWCSYGTLPFDNRILTGQEDMPHFPVEGEDDMAYRIKRTIEIGGKKKTVYADTEQEYIEKILAANGINVKKGTDNPKHCLTDYCREWFQTFAKPRIETATAVQYERAIETKIIPFFGDKYIEDITVSDVQGLFNSMGEVAKETKLKVKTPLIQIFDMAVESGLIPKNPMKSKQFSIKGAKSKDTVAYTQEQMKYLVAHIGDLQNVADRHYLAVQTMHPLRLEEVLGLQWRDIDLENNTLTVRQVVTHPTRNNPEIKVPKTEKSARVLPLSPITKQHLIVGEPDEYVVGGSSPLSYQLVRKMRERIEKQTGFNEKITPRRFRATVLTDIYDRTKDIKLTQAMAGHTNSQMTLKHYVKGRSQVIQNNVVSELYGAG